MKISAVVPTRNRLDSLLRTIAALAAQTFPLTEILIIDSSDDAFDQSLLAASDDTEIRYLRAPASVCIQRNIGIQQASGDYIFLCDDDIEPPTDYIEVIAKHIGKARAVAVSGLCLQRDANDEWVYQYPVTSFPRQLFGFIFQLGVWGDVRNVSSNALTGKLRDLIVGSYMKRANSLTRAGWPLFTQVDGDVIETKIYGLGACVLKASCFDSNHFDEVLDSHGIGDNYGIALGLSQNIHVLKDTAFHHHQEPTNRLSHNLSSYRRILALHYFLCIRSTFNSRVFLQWSLFGKLLAELIGRSPQARGTAKAMFLILLNRNPYLIGAAHGRSCIEPQV